MSLPAPLPDTGRGPVPSPGRLDVLAPGLARLTAPNPGMMTGPGTNTYLVGGPQVAVVDPGPDDSGHLERVVEAAEREGGRISWVLVTHAHADHAPGAEALADVAGAPVVAHAPRAGLAPDVLAHDGWGVEGTDFGLRALHTPGHSSDHVCYVVDLAASPAGAPRRIVLSGDHVMDRVTVVIAPPDGDMTAYLASLDRLLALDPPADALAPGHGRLLGDPELVVRAIVAHRMAREALVVGALEEAGAANESELLPVVYGDVGAERLDVARWSLRAHLDKLVKDGRAEQTARGAYRVLAR